MLNLINAFKFLYLLFLSLLFVFWDIMLQKMSSWAFVMLEPSCNSGGVLCVSGNLLLWYQNLDGLISLILESSCKVLLSSWRLASCYASRTERVRSRNYPEMPAAPLFLVRLHIYWRVCHFLSFGILNYCVSPFYFSLWIVSDLLCHLQSSYHHTHHAEHLSLVILSLMQRTFKLLRGLKRCSTA